jgi:RNA polymerase sigma factor (sigma-70 family)
MDTAKSSLIDRWITRESLLERIKDPSDAHAWEDFTQCYESFIHAVVFKMNIGNNDREDLVQNILLKVWKAMPDFSFDKSKAKFRTWLSYVIRNTVIDYCRQKKTKSAELSTDTIELAQDPQCSIEAMIEREWQIHVTKMAMASISEKFTERAIIAFKMHLNGDSMKKISSEMNIKENSSYRLVNRVKKYFILEINNLKENLEKGSIINHNTPVES